jgi:tetratricopeptide (TPR) repeat protein
MPTSLSDRLNQIGNEYFGRGLYTDAFAYYHRALEADRRTGDRRALVATLGNLGNVCAVSGRREQAQLYYQEVLELQKLVGDERGIGTTLANLGNLRTDAGEWEQARAYYLEALDMLSRAGDDIGLSVLHSNLGLVARETGNLDDALARYERSLALMRRLGNQAGVADVYCMIGKTHAIRGQYEEAASCALTSLEISRRLQDELRMAGAWYLLAGIREEQGNSAEAAELLERVVAVDRKYQLPKLEENRRRLAALRERNAAASLPQFEPVIDRTESADPVGDVRLAGRESRRRLLDRRRSLIVSACLAALVIMAGVQYLSTREPKAGDAVSSPQQVRVQPKAPTEEAARAYLRRVRDLAENSLAQVEVMAAATDKGMRTGERSETVEYGTRRLSMWRRQFLTLTPPQALQEQHREIGRLLTDLGRIAQTLQSLQADPASDATRARLLTVHDHLTQVLNDADAL